RLRFYWVVAVSGAVLMALEILSSRVLAPHFGNSVYVWGSIISVFLAALSSGYLLGGRLADRDPRMAALGRLVALAGVFEAILLLAGPRLAGLFGAWTGNSPSGTLLAATALFGPASLLLATVSPYAVRLAARDLGHLGNTTGRLYALSTLGSLGGTLACTFLLIPFLNLKPILALVLAATAVTALFALAGGGRPALPSTALAALLLVLALSSGWVREHRERGLLYERVTPYQSLEVRESEGVRTLVSDRIPQAAIQVADGEPALGYPRYAPAALLLHPGVSRLLILGMGGGSVGSYLGRRLPGLAIHYVDIDPAIPEIAQRFLSFRPDGRTQVTIADARGFLHTSEERWDLIYCDTYIGLSVPFHLTTVQFLEEVHKHLLPHGIFALNLAAGLGDPFSRAMYRTVRDRFATTYVVDVRGASNVLVLATDDNRLSWAELAERGRDLKDRLRFDPPLDRLAKTFAEVNFDPATAPLLTDEFAPVDRLIQLGRSAQGRAGPGGGVDGDLRPSHGDVVGHLEALDEPEAGEPGDRREPGGEDHQVVGLAPGERPGHRLLPGARPAVGEVVGHLAAQLGGGDPHEVDHPIGQEVLEGADVVDREHRGRRQVVTQPEGGPHVAVLDIGDILDVAAGALEEPGDRRPEEESGEEEPPGHGAPPAPQPRPQGLGGRLQAEHP
ncbi:MAG TPA: fused MFS/spermidine synthase, partial [Thermoanaerobaculia bacterium]|nr:fused MFS/spermidine synthase [Thermoanaerobaculia bacterium]